MRITPDTSGPTSFYFGYIAHDYHMAVYGAILGGFEAKAMEISKQLNRILREEFFEDISIEIGRSKMSADDFIVVGDLNAKIGVNLDGSLVSESGNGNLLLNLINSQNLKVLNFSDKCCGKWTHVVRTSEKASLLDYALISPVFSEHISSMIVDETCLFCPFSLKKSKGQTKQQFSDHNSILIELSIPRSGMSMCNKKGD